MSHKDKQELARQRMTLLIKVRSGGMTATEAAQQLGVSRKTWYEWENRALNAMNTALEDRLPGRPPAAVDTEKELLQKRVAELEKQLYLAKQTEEVRNLLAAYELYHAKKKRNRKERR
ncbi:MAG: helix-turn-helix domain-containing protein [Candidatus Nanoarchaeia archaeon]|nr:helix-turn-helix domain-containing protein [Candidatus Nanoarchaeia archaeon]MDD5547275.1 helix-turn-helix domain-containing protein [Candidatus Omnitrophota bacterium]